MAQIIPFLPTPASYPTRTILLDATESAFLTAIRWWVSAFRRREDPLPWLRRHLHQAVSRDAASSIDALMAIVARSFRRPIAIHCPQCLHVSADERRLLHAASLAQAGESALAERVLRTALLSAQGAEFALGPLNGMAEIFAQARLVVSRRQLPAADIPPPGAVEAWTPPDPQRTLH